MNKDVVELVANARKKWGRVKVDVGCGIQPRGEDFITVDKCAGEKLNVAGNITQQDGTVVQGLVEVDIKADLKAEMWELPFGDGTVDELWCSHALEHVPMAKVIPSLKEFQRVMRIGARAIITVPNFDYIAKYWLLGQNRQWAEAMVMGRQDSPGEFHQSCFNAELLRGDLQGIGFEVKVLKLVWTHDQECLQAVAVKK
jgi:predicted SAM-dependent methyltransferase